MEIIITKKQVVKVVKECLDWQSEEIDSISPASGTNYKCEFRQHHLTSLDFGLSFTNKNGIRLNYL